MVLIKRLVIVVLAAVFLAVPLGASAGNIIDLWDKAPSPKAPQLGASTVSAHNTAFLVLDIEERTCNQERRPRCVESVPRIEAFLKRARASGMPVAYSTTGQGSPETILPPVKPLTGEPVVKASVDKFLGTMLESILKEKKVETVIVCGTAAHGAVLHTATAAAQRGFQIVLPVDCLSAADLFTEKASVWALLAGPGTRRKITLTTLEAITIK